MPTEEIGAVTVTSGITWPGVPGYFFTSGLPAAGFAALPPGLLSDPGLVVSSGDGIALTPFGSFTAVVPEVGFDIGVEVDVCSVSVKDVDWGFKTGVEVKMGLEFVIITGPGLIFSLISASDVAGSPAFRK